MRIENNLWIIKLKRLCFKAFETVAIISAVVYVIACLYVVTASKLKPYTISYLKIGEAELRLNVAKSHEEQRIGLMSYKSLKSSEGMLFPVIPAQKVQIWTKNMKFPIDLLFVQSDRVSEIYSNIAPCIEEANQCPKYEPRTKIDGVIELAGGSTERLGIKIGTIAHISAG